MALSELTPREDHIWQMLKWYRPIDATPEEIHCIALKACRPLVIALYANPQAPRKDEVMDKEEKAGTGEKLLREIANMYPWWSSGHFTYCLFCLNFDDEMTHTADCVYVRARKYLNMS